jgi:hypothetical protein
MSDTTPQTADGKVLFHFAMSLDGFVAGPDHAMDWMAWASVRPGLHRAGDGDPLAAVNVRYRPVT